MYPNAATCLPTEHCFSEIAMSNSNKHVQRGYHYHHIEI